MKLRSKKVWSFLITIFSMLSLEAQENSAFASFIYHRFGDNRYPSTNIKIDQFKAQLEYLKSNQYQVVTLSEAYQQLKTNRLTSKTVVLTIDDGYQSFYQNALPLLERYGFKATLFINTVTVGATDYMSWTEIKDARERGIEIGNHSHEHPFFLSSQTDFRSDLYASHSNFEQYLGSIPKVYAYPYGEWNTDMHATLKSEGYMAAAAQNSGIISTYANPYALPRFPMSETYADINSFIQKINMLPLAVRTKEVHTKGYLGSKERPRLVLTFQEDDLQLEYLQCFIQGSACNKSIQVKKDQKVELVVKPKSPLQRRRTLITITVQDNSGQWYWYSYSYVQPYIQP